MRKPVDEHQHKKELIAVLKEEQSLYEQLLALSREKTNVLVKNDTAGLKKIMEQIQGPLDKINELEEQREKIIAQLAESFGVKRSKVTLGFLASHALGAL